MKQLSKQQTKSVIIDLVRISRPYYTLVYTRVKQCMGASRQQIQAKSTFCLRLRNKVFFAGLRYLLKMTLEKRYQIFSDKDSFYRRLKQVNLACIAAYLFHSNKFEKMGVLFHFFFTFKRFTKAFCSKLTRNNFYNINRSA